MENDLVRSLEHSTRELWFGTTQFVPQLLLALAVLILGWMIGGLVSGMVRKGFRTLRLDEALDKAGVDVLSEKAGYSFKPGQFAGSIVKWFIILAFAIVALDILNLTAVTNFMEDVVLGYLPNVFAAVLILFASIIIASLARRSMEAALRAGGSSTPEFFGKLAYYLVIGFGVIAVLNQLKIAAELMQTLFMGIVFALSLAAGLAFGLGGKDTAARYLDKITKHHR
jgi:hypothetical protein